MVSESLARRFKPAGFEQPEGSRRNYTKPRPELQEAFDRWIGELPEESLTLDKSEKQYQKACKSIQTLLEIQYREANSLLIGFKPKTECQKEAGLFISACYTHSPEETIIFDADAPEIDCIGYKSKKNIFNNGKVGDWFVSESSGLAINNGECGGEFAWGSSGIAINNGKYEGLFAWNSSGLAIMIRMPRGYVYREKGRTIKSEECDRIPELKKYIEELGEITGSVKDERSAKRFLERYGPNPKEKTKNDIMEIVRTGSKT